ncbi:monofunctional biosynthetic peptidoglycan transglycosylase [Hyphomicrobium facile]|uniref:Biosynthetic peptidoglycan transglycosylase n=1 Tax=Hyphomicrobium facile TaxID=51670 RepID=A0A1I7NQ90_9HYPH|nr:monofunctional biosynthetic peptidoglycan transglycosylase [Hyphomicrobium facile]SFV36785.1 monofunctional biosynthetic peptidoglycan transglycosylase [Hyphomicrobium facile]
MDRPDGTSGSTAAPLAPSGDQDVLSPPRPIAAAEVGAALARSLALANALSASTVPEVSEYRATLETLLPDPSPDRWQPPLPLPPRPLPARAFFETSPQEVIQTALPSEPAVEPELFAPEPQRPAVLPPAGSGEAIVAAPEDVFSAIDAEVSSRSFSKAEQVSSEILEKAEVEQPVDPFVVALPDGSERANEFLGQTIPQRMLEPRLWAPPPPPAFDGLTVDRSMRPDLAPDLAQVEKQSPAPRISAGRGSLIKRGLKLLSLLALAWLVIVLLLIVTYRFINPPASALMLQQWLTGQSISQKWVAIEDMSPNIVRAVLLSEDGRFCQHSGIDFEALEDAVERAGGGAAARGASTISMQVVKNMFLWPSKSYLRKAIELPLTYVMELVWPKHRVMEVYLNIAEWGPGIFGVEAASQYHFRKSAKSLSERDAARLAVALPNPLTRNAGKPGPGLQRLANAIQVRMRLAPSSQLTCVLPKRRI